MEHSPNPSNDIGSLSVLLILTPASTADISHYKNIRLAALKTDPDAFGSKYEREAAFADEIWTERLNTPGRTTFLASTSTHYGDDSNVDGSTSENPTRCVGTITLLAPNMLKAFNLALALPQGLQLSAGDDEIDAYMLVGMWVDPAYRSKGVGKALIRGALETARSDPSLVNADEAAANSDTSWKKIVLLDVHRANIAARRLYESCGFRLDDGVDAGTEEKLQMYLIL